MPDLATWDHLSSRTALVLFCDLQKQLVKHSGTATPKGIASSAGALFQLACLFELPAIVSVVPEGKNAPEVIDELGEGESFAPQMLRTTASLFGDQATAQAIGRSGRKVLIVAGFMLEAVILNTVLEACALGYDVVVAMDACGSSSERTEQAVLRQMESAGAVSTSVISIGTRLAPDFSTENGQRMFAIVQGIKAS